jgi:shikimate kinase
MKCYLCGLPGVGKSSCGRILAALSGFPFIDLDQWTLELQTEGLPFFQSIAELFQALGESAFGELERQALVRSLSLTQGYIALGGGTLHRSCPEQHRQLNAPVIYLKACPTVIWPRLSERGIPRFLCPKDPEAAFMRLARERDALYTACAQHTVDMGQLSSHETAAAVLEILNPRTPRNG